MSQASDLLLVSLLDGIVRLLELVNLTPYQLHLLHLTMYYALMFVLVRSASLGLELGAHLLEELSETSAWRCLPRRAHAAMRVVHDCSWLV